MATATKKKRKEEAYPWKASASSGHTTNLKQSILRLSISMVRHLAPGTGGDDGKKVAEIIVLHFCPLFDHCGGSYSK
jgi:hypothetical protein